MTEPTPPETLMLRYQQGDTQAFDSLYAQFSGRVRGYLVTRLRTPEAADEVLQSVFLKLHRARHSYREGSAFAPWLFTITQNALKDRIRREQRNPARPAALDAGKALARLPASEAGIEKEGAGSLPVELGGLDPANRELLEWRYLEEWSFEKIAARLEITALSARQRVSRAIRKLRKLQQRSAA